MKIYLEYKDEKSEKFWEVTIKGKTLITRWGKLETQGQSKSKELESPKLAKAEAEKQRASKIKKGYEEVTVKKNSATKKKTPAKKATANTSKKSKQKGGSPQQKSEREQALLVKAESFFSETDEYGDLSAFSFVELDAPVKELIYKNKDLSLRLLTHSEILTEAIDYNRFPSTWRDDYDIWLLISKGYTSAFYEYCPVSLIDADFAHAVLESICPYWDDDDFRSWIYKIRGLSFFKNEPDFILKCLKTLRGEGRLSSSGSFWLLDSAPKEFFRNRQFYLKIVGHMADVFSQLNQEERSLFGGDDVWYHWNSVIWADDVYEKLHVQEFIVASDIRSALENLKENLTTNLGLIAKFGHETFFTFSSDVSPIWKEDDYLRKNSTALEWEAVLEQL